MAFDPALASRFTGPDKTEETVSLTDLVVVDRLGEIFKAQAGLSFSGLHARLGARRRDWRRHSPRRMVRASCATSSDPNIHAGSFKGTQLLHVEFVLRRRQERLPSRIDDEAGTTSAAGNQLAARRPTTACRTGSVTRASAASYHDASLKGGRAVVQFINQTFSTIWSAHNQFTPAPAPQTAPLAGLHGFVGTTAANVAGRRVHRAAGERRGPGTARRACWRRTA